MADSDAGRKRGPVHRFLRHLVSPPVPLDQMTPAQRRYDSLSSMPMFFVAIAWLVSSFFTWAPSLQPLYRSEGFRISVATWLIFAVDFVIRFVMDPRKTSFLKRNWPFAAALIFPPLRILLVISAVFRVARDRNALTKIVGLYAVYAVLTVVTFGALFTLMFEINAPGANILSFGDAMWWGFVTVTTVGYGDFTPITVGGRVIAVMIMFTGAAAVGAVTAAVASRFINTGGSTSPSSSDQSSQQSQAAQEPQAPQATTSSASSEPSLADVLAQIQALQASVNALSTDDTASAATRETGGG